MFFHEFFYQCKRTLRDKAEIFWVLAFPMILGTFFHVAFGNINNTTETFHVIPVAVCFENDTPDHPFRTVLDALDENSENPLLSVTYTDEDTAMDLLKSKKIAGVFIAADDVTLTCPMADPGAGSTVSSIRQSILESFLREYRTCQSVMTEIAASDPSRLAEVLPLLEEKLSYKKELHLTNGNMDQTVQYYFNLIAMACLYTAFAGSQTAIKNQANLSDLGARKCVSPIRKLQSITAELCSTICTQFLCVAVNIFFLVFVLKTEFGTSLPLILFTAFIGCILGVSFGFFIGCIGKMGENLKFGIMIGVSMTCCFLSGLMLGNMHALIEQHCPIINRINPAALIADSFHTLNIYDVCQRYLNNIISLLLLSVLLILGGCMMIRRKTYASLSRVF